MNDIKLTREMQQIMGVMEAALGQGRLGLLPVRRNDTGQNSAMLCLIQGTEVDNWLQPVALLVEPELVITQVELPEDHEWVGHGQVRRTPKRPEPSGKDRSFLRVIK